MKFTLKHGDLLKQRNATLLIGVYEKGDFTPASKSLDKLTGGYISKIVKKGDFTGKSGETFLLLDVPHVTSQQVMLVGCGKNAPMSVRDYRKIISASVKNLQGGSASHLISYLPEVEVETLDYPQKVRTAAEVSANAFYVFDTYKSVKAPAFKIREITFYIAEKNALPACTRALQQAIAITDGMTLTKNLANQPSNICTPTYLADQAEKLGRQYKSITVKVLEESAMKKLGMNSLLSVSKGSAQDAKLVCLEYKGKSSKAPVALVGKGITFDTGGISLKPAESMVGMKYDMCGAATVLGTMQAIADLKLPIHVVGILAIAENMPGGKASKPEDIVTTMSGVTVEILNTDAEGRLVLADALTYVERYKPEVVIDIATLTGAVVIALGHHASGLLSNNDTLAENLLEAGRESQDRAWKLPLWDEYQDQIKSPFADICNTGGRAGGTITAACFLSRFAKKFKWAHLDVAGTAAMMGGVDRYATGRPVPLLTQYLINRCKK
jgi:leucyl aminopeptidase